MGESRDSLPTVRTPSVPVQWKPYFSSRKNAWYYVNHLTKKSTWTKPNPWTLLEDWIQVCKNSGGSKMFSNSHPQTAIVTLVMCGDAYVPGALCLAHSYRLLSGKSSLICMVTSDVSDRARFSLSQLFDHVIQVPYIQQTCLPLNTPKKEWFYASWKSVSFTKWNILALEPFDKVLFMDADTICIQKGWVESEIWSLSPPAGTFSSPWHAPWNPRAIKENPYALCKHGDFLSLEDIRFSLEYGSVIIGTSVLIEPNLSMWKGFKDWLSSQYPTFGAAHCSSMVDEQAIVKFYTNYHNTSWTYLHQKYNVIPWKMNPWIGDHKPAVLHYFSKKPWDIDRKEYPDLEFWWTVADSVKKLYPKTRFFFSPSTDSVAKHYDIVKSEENETQTRKRPRQENRSDGPVGPIRLANNVCKAALCGTMLSALRLKSKTDNIHIMDLCGGSGSDADKWRRLARDSSMYICSYTGIDFSTESVRVGNTRLQKVIQSARNTDGMDSFTALMISADLQNPPLHVPPKVPIQNANVVQCFFALHYFFKSKCALDSFAMWVGKTIREGGFFVSIHADGPSMAQMGISQQKGDAEPCVAEIVPAPEVLSKNELSSPYGNRYTFTLGDRVRGVDEYLVDEDTLDKTLLRFAFMKRVWTCSLDQLYNSLGNHTYWKHVRTKIGPSPQGTGLTIAQWNTLKLYRANIYVQDMGMHNGEVLQSMRDGFSQLLVPSSN